jgi:hypothetical protein
MLVNVNYQAGTDTTAGEKASCKVLCMSADTRDCNSKDIVFLGIAIKKWEVKWEK